MTDTQKEFFELLKIWFYIRKEVSLSDWQHVEVVLAIHIKELGYKLRFPK